MNKRILLLTLVNMTPFLYASPAAQTTEIKKQQKNYPSDDSQDIPNEISQDDNEPVRTLVLSPAAPSAYMQQVNTLSQQFARDLPAPDEAKKRFKEQKKLASRKKVSIKNSPRKPNLTISEMDFMQLLQRKNELILEGEYEIALKYLDKMSKLTENAEQLVFIMLECGELLMKTGQFAKAEKMFDEFTKLYPGNEYAEQAYVKAIECSWQQTANHDRDQTKTEETLKLIEQFESRNAIYAQENIERVSEFKYLCQQKLADSNLYVAEHYIKRGVFRSAHKRLDDARTNDLKLLPEIEPNVLNLEIQLALAEKNDQMHEQKITELIEKFPTHELTLALKPDASKAAQTA